MPGPWSRVFASQLRAPFHSLSHNPQESKKLKTKGRTTVAMSYGRHDGSLCAGTVLEKRHATFESFAAKHRSHDAWSAAISKKIIMFMC